jgi:hypothetical protein
VHAPNGELYTYTILHLYNLIPRKHIDHSAFKMYAGGYSFLVLLLYRPYRLLFLVGFSIEYFIL